MLAAMLENVVPLFITIFQMKRLVIICDLSNSSLYLKKQFFTGEHTVKLAQSLVHMDNNVLMESNIILCGRDGLAAVTDETFGINYPWVIMHKRDDEVFIHPSGINQQLYFYNEDTNSLYEKYQVNTVVVTRQLNFTMPMENVYERRADLHGLSLNVAVNSIFPLYEIKKENKDAMTLASGDEFYTIKTGDTFGMLEDLLQVMSRELNFTIR